MSKKEDKQEVRPEVGSSDEDNIILTEAGTYFGSEAVALQVIEKKQLDLLQWEPASVGRNKWFIRRVGTTVPPEPKKVDVKWVRFHERQNENEQVDIHIIHNGDTLVCQRGQKIPVPVDYLSIIDDAKYPVYSNPKTVDEIRQVIGHVRLYNYDDLGPATIEDYKAFRRRGTAETRKRLKQAAGEN